MYIVSQFINPYQLNSLHICVYILRERELDRERETRDKRGSTREGGGGRSPSPHKAKIPN